jgi:hypothetical protein
MCSSLLAKMHELLTEFQCPQQVIASAASSHRSSRPKSTNSERLRHDLGYQNDGIRYSLLSYYFGSATFGNKILRTALEWYGSSLYTRQEEQWWSKHHEAVDGLLTGSLAGTTSSPTVTARVRSTTTMNARASP